MYEKSSIWVDHARIYGIKIPFVKFFMTNNRIYTKRGLLSVKEDEVLLYRVLDITLKMSIMERLTKTGTIILYTNDVSCPTIILNGIKDPRNVRMLISEAVESARQSAGIRGTEMLRGEAID